MYFLSLFGCFGLNVAKVPNQDIYADDGDTRTSSADVHFAVAGDVRPALPGEKTKRAVTPDTALRLARVLGMSADFWLGLQQDWDLWHALRSDDAAEIAHLQPLRHAS